MTATFLRRNRFTQVTVLLTSVTLSAVFAAAGAPALAQETPTQALGRAHLAHGGPVNTSRILDWTAAGQIKITGDPRGPFQFTLSTKGTGKVQRIVEYPDGQLKYGSDGTRTWQGDSRLWASAASRATYFVESYTLRSLQRAFSHTTEGVTLKSLGKKVNDLLAGRPDCAVIEGQDSTGRQTSYYIDDATSLVTRLEFDTGASYSQMFSGKPIPILAVLVFSDYRIVEGVSMPFKVEFYEGFIKVEEMTFSSVIFNTGSRDDSFRP